MWIVRLALRRPYTFVVAALLAAILGVLSLTRMSTDVFPDVDVPVISVIFNYTGMSADDMERRIVTNFERFLTTTVNDVEHVESQSLYGVGVVKVFLQKGAKVEAATAQITAVGQTSIRQMPPGTNPPLILRYNASNVPILQLAIGSETLPEQSLFDLTVNTLRPQLVVIPGVQIPYPYGGKQRQVMVDLDPEAMHAHGLSPSDVTTALGSQNLILPAGTIKVGPQEYQVRVASSPAVVDQLNDMPMRTVDGTTVLLRDVAHVRDGFSPQTNVVHTDGKRGVLLSILKSGGSSTLDVVEAIQKALPQIRTTLPPDLEITPIFDQSLFVRAAVEGVVKEAAIAAGLTGLVILLFLGSWRSTLVVVTSIPLSILVSIVALYLLGQTINVTTLGGLALAVGMLVDDATVEIENIHRNLHQRKRLVQAILDGARQIAVPAFVSTLCICIVFVPVAFISGAAKHLFTPLAMAVVFAMATSYVLSRTLVPTMVHHLLASEVARYGGEPERATTGASSTPPRGLRSRRTRLLLLVGAIAAAAAAFPFRVAIADTFAAHRRELTFAALWTALGGALLWLVARLDLLWRGHALFDRAFEAMRRGYGGLLAWALDHRLFVTSAFALFVAGSLLLYPLVGHDFFPAVDAGQFRLHVRVPPGTRIEETERTFAAVEQAIRDEIPRDEVTNLLANMGIPYSGINLSMSDGSVNSPADGEILVALSKPHRPTDDYVTRLRHALPERFPELVFFFQPPDIASQVLNFGLAAPIDVQVAGPVSNSAANEALARRILAEVQRIPGAADARLQQVPRTPDLRVAVDRTLASQAGVTQRDVASDLLIALSSSNQTSPSFWLNPVNSVNYAVYVQTPQTRLDSLNALENSPISTGSAAATQLLSSVATVGRGTTPANVTHYDVMPTFDVLLGTAGADLGSVADGVRAVVERHRAELPRGSTITLRGQVESMRTSFEGLAYGLVFSVLLVYLLMVVNFQSWLDPLVILSALPSALAGILWMLFATATSVSVPALTGAIMSIGVATANSVLMVTFANDQRQHGLDARGAALAAGLTRLRPVVMTALAMTIGMVPIALGRSEGGEQNAPLGRAVIGGLALATFTTLFFVPVVYASWRRAPPHRAVEPELAEPELP
jgi:multidrug efflux pump subunit AcrB